MPLSTRDLRAALEVSLEAQAAETIHDLRYGLLRSLRNLVGCDAIGYNEIDLRSGTVLGIVDPPDVAPDEMERRFLGVIDQHPLVRCQQAGDLGVKALSDFLSARRFHGLALYHDFYKLVGAQDQLAFGLGGEQLVAFALCRPSRSFTQRDRALLELVRPHLSLAYHRARMHERIHLVIEALDSGLEARNAGVVQVDESGRVAYASGGAAELIESYFGPVHLGDYLPPALGGDREHPSAVPGPRGQLRVYEDSNGRPGWRTLVLEEQRADPPSIERLVSLGLTGRQAQVLRLLARGKHPRQVAAELQISTATVGKHVEHIYERLDVHNRAELMVRIRG